MVVDRVGQKPSPGRKAVTQTQLKAMLHYDSATGKFFWRVARPPKIRIGDRAGCVICNRYWGIRIDNKRYYAHRLAFLYIHGRFPNGQLDHKDRDRANNRIENLREATTSQNIMNAKLHKDSYTKFKGVHQDKKRNKYGSRIIFKRKTTWLGYYESARTAALVYDYAATRVFGEFALTNKMLGLL